MAADKFIEQIRVIYSQNSFQTTLSKTPGTKNIHFYLKKISGAGSNFTL